MCGIVGMIQLTSGLSDTDRRVVGAMSATLAARGPDAAASKSFARAELAHRRLAIIDLAGGAQPMTDPSGRYTIVFNGEIYNHGEIAAKLRDAGVHPTSRSDTEVLLLAYAHYGPACLDLLNGDFAFAVWDEVEGALFLARDRLGIKPLFHAEVGGAVYFASEVKALLAVPGIDRTLDPYALIEGLAYLQPLAPRTLVRGVKSLDAGHWLRVDARGVTSRRYWDLPTSETILSPADARATVRELLVDATRIRLQSDVPVAAMLSGGLDSSILCALIRAERDHLATFTTGFGDGGVDAGRAASTRIIGSDRDFARQVAEALGTDHAELLLEAGDLLGDLRLASGARDLPAAYGSEAAILKLCAHIRSRGYPVVLSGEGADEVFLGYHYFHEPRALAKAPDPFYMTRLDRMGFVFDREFARRHQPLDYVRDRFQDAVARAPRRGRDQAEVNLNVLHYAQLKLTLPYLLDRADRLSMAASVELRVPFLDHRLVEAVYAMSPAVKNAVGQEKALLRDAFADILPESVQRRAKSVFPYPATARDSTRLFAAAHAAVPFFGKTTPAKAVFQPALVRYLTFLARRGVVPTVGSHFLASTIAHLDELSARYDLPYAPAAG